jgi:subtilisin
MPYLGRVQQPPTRAEHDAIVYPGGSLVTRMTRSSTRRSLAAVLVLALLGLVVPAGAAASDTGQRWIVQLAPSADVDRFVAPLERSIGVRPTHVFGNVIRGFAASLSPRQLAALRADPRVLNIQPDLPTTVAADPQPVPPGISRVGANPSAWRAVDGSDPVLAVDIAILDTGIDAKHPDLRVVGGRNCTTTTASWDVDKHGHGTHVAGITAARDNAFGVVGVAPGARLWSVKVLNNKGNGYASWLICGLDWLATRTDPNAPTQPRIEVANMSLRMSGSDDGNCGQTNGDLVHQAVCRLERAGVTIVVAAGNDARNAANYVPAAYAEVITVSALADYDGLPGGLASPPPGCPRSDTDDAFAPFSNFGADIDIIAPGVCIYSTLPNSSYGVMSGTSMAAPHVAGGVALYHLFEIGQGRGRPTPRQARAALIAAGSSAWHTASDPDKSAEPLLDVASLELPSTFEIGVTPAVQQRQAGEVAAFDVWLARLGGFAGNVELNVAGQPPGATWNMAGGAFTSTESGWRRVNLTLPAATATGTYDITFSAASSGYPARSVVARMQVEGGLVGAAGAPRMVLRKNVATQAVAVPVKVKWQAVKNAQRYELQVSRDGSAWTQVSLPSRTALAVNVNVWPHSTYRYRLRVRKNDSWGTWLIGPPTVVTPHYAGESVGLVGSWTTYHSTKTYAEMPAYSTQAGARASLSFNGTGVSWVATRGPKRGKARIFIDGVLAAKIDLYAPSNQFRRVVFRRSWSAAGNHTITVEVRGTSGRPRVDLDVIFVVSTN